VSKILHLTLKKEFFDLIASGKKLFEYREVKRHWITRLSDEGTKVSEDWEEMYTFVPKKFDYVIFKNGYAKNAPTLKMKLLDISIEKNISTPLGKGDFFVLRLGEIVS